MADIEPPRGRSRRGGQQRSAHTLASEGRGLLGNNGLREAGPGKLVRPRNDDGFGEAAGAFEPPILAPLQAPVIFFERARAVRSADGQVMILLMLDVPTLEPGYLLNDIAPCGWLRTTDNGMGRLTSAAAAGMEILGLAVD